VRLEGGAWIERDATFFGSHTAIGYAVTGAALFLLAAGLLGLFRREVPLLSPLVLAAALLIAFASEDVAAQSLNGGIACELPPQVSTDCRQPILHATFLRIERSLGSRKLSPVSVVDGPKPALTLTMVSAFLLAVGAAYASLRLLIPVRWLAATVVAVAALFVAGFAILDLSLRGWNNDDQRPPTAPAALRANQSE
jgi:4-hydroxybenzoate polyprenyltransferase